MHKINKIPGATLAGARLKSLCKMYKKSAPSIEGADTICGKRRGLLLVLIFVLVLGGSGISHHPLVVGLALVLGLGHRAIVD